MGVSPSTRCRVVARQSPAVEARDYGTWRTVGRGCRLSSACRHPFPGQGPLRDAASVADGDAVGAWAPLRPGSVSSLGLRPPLSGAGSPAGAPCSDRRESPARIRRYQPCQTSTLPIARSTIRRPCSRVIRTSSTSWTTTPTGSGRIDPDVGGRRDDTPASAAPPGNERPGKRPACAGVAERDAHRPSLGCMDRTPAGVKRTLRGAATVAAGCAAASHARLHHRAPLPRSGLRPPPDPTRPARSTRHPAEQGQALLRSGSCAETIRRKP